MLQVIYCYIFFLFPSWHCTSISWNVSSRTLIIAELRKTGIWIVPINIWNTYFTLIRNNRKLDPSIVRNYCATTESKTLLQVLRFNLAWLIPKTSFFFVPNDLRGHSITTWTRWGERGSKNVCVCPRSGYKNCPPWRGGGQKTSKLCPRSRWTTPYIIEGHLVIYKLHCSL